MQNHPRGVRARGGGAMRWLALAVLLTAASGCSDSPTGQSESRALVAARARWNATKPATDRYVMVQRVECFCITGANRYRVTVANGVITAVVQDPSAVPLEQTYWSMFRTVPQLFDAVRDAERRAGTLREVEYDATLGFPRIVSLDPLRNAADDEVRYVTLSVTPSP